MVYGASITENVNIGGVSALVINTGLDLISGTLDFATNAGFLAINAAVDQVVAELSFSEPPSLVFDTTLGDVGSSLDFASGPGVALPDVIAPDRIWRVPPDLPLDLVGVFYQPQQVQPTWIKDKDARLDYAVDWSGWMSTLTGDQIEQVLVLNPQGDITVPMVQRRAGNLVAFWVEGGTAGRASFTLRVTTALGRRDDRTIRFLIEER